MNARQGWDDLRAAGPGAGELARTPRVGKREIERARSIGYASPAQRA